MPNVLSPLVKQQFIGPTGAPIAFGLLYTYEAGTTTPLATYGPSGAANTNPVVLDAAGRADVWVPANVAYKFSLTDSAGNQIPGWPIDNIVSNQLITLYGGVDTGALNAYVIDFNGPFSTLTDGIVIYFIPTHTNTDASTINVNGLGVIAITNPDGSALKPDTIVTNEPCQIMYYNGAWLLLNAGYFGGLVFVNGNLTVNGTAAFGSAAANGVTAYGTQAAAQVDMTPDSGSFTGTFLGFSGTFTTTVTWYRVGRIVYLTFTAAQGTSNAVTFKLTNLPSYLQSSALRTFDFALPFSGMEDNSANGFTSGATISNSATLTFSKAGSANGWTASGNKGFATDITLSYALQ